MERHNIDGIPYWIVICDGSAGKVSESIDVQRHAIVKAPVAAAYHGARASEGRPRKTESRRKSETAGNTLARQTPANFKTEIRLYCPTVLYQNGGIVIINLVRTAPGE